MTRLAGMFLSVAFCFAVRAQSVETVAFSQASAAVSAYSAHGPVSLDAREMRVRLSLAGGRKEEGSLTILFDHDSGCFLWGYSRGEGEGFLGSFRNGEAAAYKAPDRLMEFSVPRSPGMSLSITEWRTKADSLDSAEQQALNEMSRVIAAHRGYFAPDEVQQIGVPGLREFRCASNDSMCNNPVRIISITHEDGKWRLAAHNRWDQEIILDSKLEFVSTRRLPDGEK